MLAYSKKYECVRRVELKVSLSSRHPLIYNYVFSIFFSIVANMYSTGYLIICLGFFGTQTKSTKYLHNEVLQSNLKTLQYI